MGARARARHQYLEIQQSVQLVLNDGQRLNQLLRVHGAHHAIDPDQTENASVRTGGKNSRAQVDAGENNGHLRQREWKQRHNGCFGVWSRRFDSQMKSLHCSIGRV